jgi:hypothetical protein
MFQSKPVALLLIWATCSPLIAANGIVYGVEGNGFVYRVVTRDVKELDLDRLLVTARRFQRELIRQNRGFGQLIVVRSAADAAWFAGKGMSDVDVEWWRTEYIRQRSSPYPVARITATKRACVLQVRATTGTIKRVLCGGDDPLRIDAEGKYEILIISPSYTRQGTPEHNSGVLKATVFVRLLDTRQPGAPNISLWFRLSELLSIPVLDVRVRPDLWFIEDTAFPVLYPFQQPSDDDVGSNSSSQWGWTCWREEKELRCSGQSGGSSSYSTYELGRPRSDR